MLAYHSVILEAYRAALADWAVKEIDGREMDQSLIHPTAVLASIPMHGTTVSARWRSSVSGVSIASLVASARRLFRWRVSRRPQWRARCKRE